MVDGMQDRETYQTILAHPKNMTSFKDAIKKGEAANEDELFRKSNTYTDGKRARKRLV